MSSGFFFDGFRESDLCIRFAMHETDWWRAGKGAIPVNQSALVGMRGKAADRVNARIDSDFFTEDSNPVRTIDEFSSKGSASLIANDNDLTFGLPEIVP